MRARRPSSAAPALDATAEHLPFDDDKATSTAEAAERTTTPWK
jgi:hypothetical protein